MQRKNLIIDEILLREVKRGLDVNTESEAVNRSLQEVARLLKIRELALHFGTDAWSGQLSKMREDKASPKKTKKQA
jgi:Arc/MetJ family transcription regulator